MCRIKTNLPGYVQHQSHLRQQNGYGRTSVTDKGQNNTGIILPFISYGGTSVAILLSEMGLVLNVSRQIRFDAAHPIE